MDEARTPLRGLGERFRLRDSRGSRAAQIDWELTQFEESSATGVDVEVNIWEVLQRFIYEETDEQGIVQTGEQFWRTLTVPLSSGISGRLGQIYNFSSCQSSLSSVQFTVESPEHYKYELLKGAPFCRMGSPFVPHSDPARIRPEALRSPHERW